MLRILSILGWLAMVPLALSWCAVLYRITRSEPIECSIIGSDFYRIAVEADRVQVDWSWGGIDGFSSRVEWKVMCDERRERGEYYHEANRDFRFSGHDLQPLRFLESGHWQCQGVLGELRGILPAGGVKHARPLPGLNVRWASSGHHLLGEIFVATWDLDIVLSLLTAMVLAARFRNLARWLRTRYRLSHGFCPFCGYDLRHSHSVCPECGLPVVKLHLGNAKELYAKSSSREENVMRS